VSDSLRIEIQKQEIHRVERLPDTIYMELKKQQRQLEEIIEKRKKI
jgi:hypothetical protein